MKLSRVVPLRNLVVAGRRVAQIKADDLGLLAGQSRACQRTIFQPKQLTVQAVFEKLRGISTLRGNSSGTTKEKEEKIKVSSSHWCLKSENHRKTIESNGLGAENH